MKTTTIKTQRNQWRSDIPKTGKRFVLVNSNEEPQRFIMMDMQVETNVVKRGGKKSMRVKKILIRKKSLSLMSGIRVLRLFGNAVTGV